VWFHKHKSETSSNRRRPASASTTYDSSNLDNLLFWQLFSCLSTPSFASESLSTGYPSKMLFPQSHFMPLHQNFMHHHSLSSPTHKADRFFGAVPSSSNLGPATLSNHSGNIWHNRCSFPLHAQLWLHSTGELPTYSWFTSPQVLPQH